MLQGPNTVPGTSRKAYGVRVSYPPPGESGPSRPRRCSPVGARLSAVRARGVDPRRNRPVPVGAPSGDESRARPPPWRCLWPGLLWWPDVVAVGSRLPRPDSRAGTGEFPGRLRVVALQVQRPLTGHLVRARCWWLGCHGIDPLPLPFRRLGVGSRRIRIVRSDGNQAPGNARGYLGVDHPRRRRGSSGGTRPRPGLDEKALVCSQWRCRFLSGGRSSAHGHIRRTRRRVRGGGGPGLDSLPFHPLPTGRAPSHL